MHWLIMRELIRFFYGEKLLTTANPETNSDMKLFDSLGIPPERQSIEHVPAATLQTAQAPFYNAGVQ